MVKIGWVACGILPSLFDEITVKKGEDMLGVTMERLLDFFCFVKHAWMSLENVAKY